MNFFLEVVFAHPDEGSRNLQLRRQEAGLKRAADLHRRQRLPDNQLHAITASAAPEVEGSRYR